MDRPIKNTWGWFNLPLIKNTWVSKDLLKNHLHEEIKKNNFIHQLLNNHHLAWKKWYHGDLHHPINYDLLLIPLEWGCCIYVPLIFPFHYNPPFWGFGRCTSMTWTLFMSIATHCPKIVCLKSLYFLNTKCTPTQLNKQNMLRPSVKLQEV